MELESLGHDLDGLVVGHGVDALEDVLLLAVWGELLEELARNLVADPVLCCYLGRLLRVRGRDALDLFSGDLAFAGHGGQ